MSGFTTEAGQRHNQHIALPTVLQALAGPFLIVNLGAVMSAGVSRVLQKLSPSNDEPWPQRKKGPSKSRHLQRFLSPVVREHQPQSS